MIRHPISRPEVVVLGLLSLLLLLAGYHALSLRQHAKNPDDTTIPSWSQLGDGIRSAFEPNRRSGERWVVEDAKATLGRLSTGLFFGTTGAVVIGVLMGCFPRIEALFAPPLAILAKIPPTAALAVFFVLFGTELKMYAAMIAFGILPSLAQSVYLAVVDIPDEVLHKSYTLGASHAEVIWNVILPLVVPPMIDAIRLQIGPAMVYLIAAEMVTGDVGFGYRIRLQSRLLNMNVVYPYLALLAAFGFAMDTALRRLSAWWNPWYAERAR